MLTVDYTAEALGTGPRLEVSLTWPRGGVWVRGGWALGGIMAGDWGWSLGTSWKDWAGLKLICSRTQEVQNDGQR